MESQRLLKMYDSKHHSSLFIKKIIEYSLPVHDEPSIGKIEEASNSLKALGYKLLPNIIPSSKKLMI